MKTFPEKTRPTIPVTRVLLAGLAGGLAEVLWVMGYSTLMPLTSAAVAQEITRTVLPSMATSAGAPLLGLGIHLLLSLVLALVFVRTLVFLQVQHGGAGRILASGVLALLAVWIINFLLLLPALNPAFTTLMPWPVTFISKGLFGLAMGAVLSWPSGQYTASRKLQAAGQT